jgi:hypothetical protein
MDQATIDLETAYEILEERGWCQHAFMNLPRKVCLDGALRLAIVDRATLEAHDWAIYSADADRYIMAADRIMRVLDINYRTINIWVWNDAPERSVEDVKLVLKKAIAGE